MEVAARGNISATELQALQEIVGADNVLYDEESLKHYGHDETELLLFLPEVVVKPAETA